jgi:hypothetical protein
MSQFVFTCEMSFFISRAAMIPSILYCNPREGDKEK